MTISSFAAARASRRCPALLISAPASGQGKTTVTAALARHWCRQGLRVRVFKTGPDFIDPMVHAHASGGPCYQLDLWMGGEAHCRELLWQAATASAAASRRRTRSGSSAACTRPRCRDGHVSASLRGKAP